MKTCSECKKEYPVLWKAKTKEHGALCRDCWQRYKSGETSLITSKKTLKRKGYIKPVSYKKAKELSKYRRLRDEYMKENSFCEVSGCSRKATDLHHRVSREFALLDIDVFMAVCRECHNKIEENDRWARENGYKLSKHKYNIKNEKNIYKRKDNRRAYK